MNISELSIYHLQELGKLCTEAGYSSTADSVIIAFLFVAVAFVIGYATGESP